MTGLGLSTPTGIAVDSQNNLWIADTNDSRVVQATNQGAFLGELDGFSQPLYLTFDAAGSLFITDTGSSVIDQFLFN
jgi:DNA-binding beta-propeller fold protein YncE